MITEIKKDLLLVEEGLILQQTNCIGVMGGLAGAIAQKWPIVKNEYLELITTNRKQLWKLLGTYQTVSVGENLKVLNVFGQYDIGGGYYAGRKTEYGTLLNALKLVANTEFPKDIQTIEHLIDDEIEYIEDVYIPFQIGCGLGGGNWTIVRDIIEESFKDSNKNVYICKI
jgi:hypothetical protein